MGIKKFLLWGIPAIFLAWCASELRWSASFTEDVVLTNGTKIEVTRIARFRQAGSDTTLGFGRGGVAREWEISFPSIANPNQTISWDAVDRVPIILDFEKKTERLFIVSVKPFSNGLLGDHHWPNGKQNPYYVYEFDGQAWTEVPFRSDLIGRKNNLLVRFDHFYVKSPTPRNIGHVTLEEKTNLESKQDEEIKADRYKYNLKYRLIGEHTPNPG